MFVRHDPNSRKIESQGQGQGWLLAAEASGSGEVQRVWAW